jgi:hypothetical protein
MNLRSLGTNLDDQQRFWIYPLGKCLCFGRWLAYKALQGLKVALYFVKSKMQL